ncbi:MAG: hypothetical protein QOF78_591 [Phycisphaerales bacterium]|jgi:hypothetical protein|nr:hypothetical protein [Phycisphaerales bacterium]
MSTTNTKHEGIIESAGVLAAWLERAAVRMENLADAAQQLPPGDERATLLIDAYVPATRTFMNGAEQLHAASKRAMHALQQLAAREGKAT